MAREPQVDFTPPIIVVDEPFQVLWEEQDPLSLFLRFFGGLESLEAVSVATNARAERDFSASIQAPNPRPWKPVQPTELLHYLGVLFYMANHYEANRKAYWDTSEEGPGHHLGQYVAETRWDQIHRFWSFNKTPTTPDDPWYTAVEPIASIIRTNCQNAVKASLWIAVDEAMVLFTGRAKHTVQMLSKPIPEGYKVWVLGIKKGYIWSWRWYSKADGPELISKSSRFYS